MTTLPHPARKAPASAQLARAQHVVAEPVLVRHIAQEVARRNGNAAALCRGLGFGLTDLERIDFRVSFAQTSRVILRAERMLGQDDLGLRLGASFSLVSWGLCFVGVMACARPQQALDFAFDFQPSTSRFLRLHKQTVKGQFIATAEPEFDTEDGVAEFLVHHAFASVARLCRFVVAPWYGPQRVELRSAVPANPRVHEEAFGCPVRFGCRTNRVVFDLIDHPIATADPSVAAMCRHALELQRSGAGAPSELEAAIVLALRTDLRTPPTMAAIAASINLSERTLRRRLLESGLSYAALLDHERMRRALDLLHDDELTLDLVAEASGFADARSLRRAIKRWTGHTPTHFRSHG
jgi:AraC-like DNA-binding protein